MTWICRNCEKRNIWWKNECVRCHEPVAGFREADAEEPEDRPFSLEDVIRKVREGDCHGFGQALVYPRLLNGDCNCPTDNYVCMNTACPRAPRTSC